jgi:hypothetical protein
LIEVDVGIVGSDQRTTEIFGEGEDYFIRPREAHE